VDADEALSILSANPARTGIFTDFDGTLSEIVDRPEDAVAVAGAAETLSTLARSFAVVAVVSGRALEDLRLRLPADGVVLAGSYGRERSDRPGSRRPVEGWESVLPAAAAMVEDLPGVVLELKGAGVALHYRAVPTLGNEVRRRAGILAAEFGLEVLQGRLVAELIPPGPKKGDAVAAIASERDLDTALVAGDDVADLEAFRWARSSGLRNVLIAVISEEAPPDLEASSDLAVSGPGELVSFLRRLAGAVA
jgi:trehalose 6-phosphate phosphatase